MVLPSLYGVAGGQWNIMIKTYIEVASVKQIINKHAEDSGR